MKWIRCLILLNVSILLIQGCQSPNQKEKEIEQKIVTKIRQDTPYLAHLEAIYSINYINYQDRKILGKRIPYVNDEVYIRNDAASVFYGYPLKDADIRVITENDQRILRVKLPQPKQISIDRKVLSIEVNDPGYVLRDEKGQRTDVDAYMDSRVKDVIKMYEKRTIYTTREMSKQYFQAIADRFSLKLQLEFVSGAGIIEEQIQKKTQ